MAKEKRVKAGVVRQLAGSSKGIGVKTTQKSVWNEVRGKAHFHFCSDRSCRQIYEDTCRTPEVNGRCQTCRGTSRNTIMVRDPRPCCVGNTRQIVDPEDMKRYKLAGPGPWYVCNTCVRSMGWPTGQPSTRGTL